MRLPACVQTPSVLDTFGCHILRQPRALLFPLDCNAGMGNAAEGDGANGAPGTSSPRTLLATNARKLGPSRDPRTTADETRLRPEQTLPGTEHSDVIPKVRYRARDADHTNGTSSDDREALDAMPKFHRVLMGIALVRAKQSRDYWSVIEHSTAVAHMALSAGCNTGKGTDAGVEGAIPEEH